MATFWEKVRYYANKKVKRQYMNIFRHDRKCPNCKMWTSEVGGCKSIDDRGHHELMECNQCGFASKWDCMGMMPTLSKDQGAHYPKAD